MYTKTKLNLPSVRATYKKTTIINIGSVRNLSFTLVKNEKVEHYIRIKVHKFIVLRFWVENDVNILCD